MGQSLNCHNIELCKDVGEKCEQICEHRSKSQGSNSKNEEKENPQLIEFPSIGSIEEQESVPPQSAQRFAVPNDEQQEQEYEASAASDPKISSDSFQSSVPTEQNEKEKATSQTFDVVIKSKNQMLLVKGGTQSFSARPGISLPFKMVLVYQHPNLLKIVEGYLPNFLSQNEQNEEWKCHAKGIFFSGNSTYGTFFQKEKFYQGSYMRTIEVEEQQEEEQIQKSEYKYLPNQRGIFITYHFIYDGDLKQGLPHGKGNYFSLLPSKQKFEGTWKMGKKVFGKLETQYFQYYGSFQNQVPHGTGELVIPKRQIMYKGSFKNGRFEDQLGFYDCPEYSYKGEFKSGKRDGKGTIMLKQISKSICGKWEKDKLDSEQQIY